MEGWGCYFYCVSFSVNNNIIVLHVNDSMYGVVTHHFFGGYILEWELLCNEAIACEFVITLWIPVMQTSGGQAEKTKQALERQSSRNVKTASQQASDDKTDMTAKKTEGDAQTKEPIVPAEAKRKVKENLVTSASLPNSAEKGEKPTVAGEAVQSPDSNLPVSHPSPDKSLQQQNIAKAAQIEKVMISGENTVSKAALHQTNDEPDDKISPQKRQKMHLNEDTTSNTLPATDTTMSKLSSEIEGNENQEVTQSQVPIAQKTSPTQAQKIEQASKIQEVEESSDDFSWLYGSPVKSEEDTAQANIENIEVAKNVESDIQDRPDPILAKIQAAVPPTLNFDDLESTVDNMLSCDVVETEKLDPILATIQAAVPPVLNTLAIIDESNTALNLSNLHYAKAEQIYYGEHQEESFRDGAPEMEKYSLPWATSMYLSSNFGCNPTL